MHLLFTIPVKWPPCLQSSPFHDYLPIALRLFVLISTGLIRSHHPLAQKSFKPLPTSYSIKPFLFNGTLFFSSFFNSFLSMHST